MGEVDLSMLEPQNPTYHHDRDLMIEILSQVKQTNASVVDLRDRVLVLETTANLKAQSELRSDRMNKVVIGLVCTIIVGLTQSTINILSLILHH